MTLDIYAGSLTRYYAHDWETLRQKNAREQGLTLDVVRPDTGDDAVTDPDEIRPALIAWRDQLSEALGDNIDGPLDWNETGDAPYFTDEPTWECYSSLLLWATYSEHPDLSRPRSCVADWRNDPAYRRSSDAGSATTFPQLLRDAEVWLPHDVPFVFRAPDPTGGTLHFGSSLRLNEELEALNRRTWNASELALAEWRRAGIDYAAPLEIAARFAFSILTDLTRKAVAHRLVIKLDY